MAKGADVKPKPTGKKKTAEKDKMPQAKRFKETARLLGADETGRAFEKRFELLVPRKVAN